MIDLINRILFYVLSVAIGIAFAGCEAKDQPPIGSNYPPVTALQLRNADFSYRTGAEEFDFSWTFKGEEFLLKGKDIPTDLIEAMLGPDVKTTKIEGTWEIRDRMIHFFVGTNNTKLARKCSMQIYRTGPIRIQSSEAQYVF